MDTPIRDLAPLSQCPALRLLSVRNCPIEDFSPLSNLPQINILRLEGTQLDDLSPLANLRELSVLELNETGDEYCTHILFRVCVVTFWKLLQIGLGIPVTCSRHCLSV